VTTTTMRVTHRSLETVRYLSSVTGQKQQEVIDKAVESYRRQVFLGQANAAFAELKSDEEAWNRESCERAGWDNTLSDSQE
jgi:hypothetical protein